MTKFIPKKVKAIVIGGGVAGCSTAYHLAKFGWKDIILLERDQLTSGTNLACSWISKSAGANGCYYENKKIYNRLI